MPERGALDEDPESHPVRGRRDRRERRLGLERRNGLVPCPVARERVEEVVREPDAVEAERLGALRPSDRVGRDDLARREGEAILRQSEPDAHRGRIRVYGYGEGDACCSSTNWCAATATGPTRARAWPRSPERSMRWM